MRWTSAAEINSDLYPLPPPHPISIICIVKVFTGNCSLYKLCIPPSTAGVLPFKRQAPAVIVAWQIFQILPTTLCVTDGKKLTRVLPLRIIYRYYRFFNFLHHLMHLFTLGSKSLDFSFLIFFYQSMPESIFVPTRPLSFIIDPASDGYYVQ